MARAFSNAKSPGSGAPVRPVSPRRRGRARREGSGVGKTGRCRPRGVRWNELSTLASGYFDLFRQIAVFQPLVRRRNHRDHVACPGEMGGDVRLRVDDGGIGGRAEVGS